MNKIIKLINYKIKIWFEIRNSKFEIYPIFITCLFLISSTVHASINTLQSLNQQIKDLEKQITPLEWQMTSLSGQILYLDNLIKSKQAHRSLLNKKINLLQEDIISETEKSFEAEQLEEIEKNKIKRLTLEHFREENHVPFWEKSKILSAIFNLFWIDRKEKEKQGLFLDINKLNLASLTNKKTEHNEEIERINERKRSIQRANQGIQENKIQISEIKKSKITLLEYTKWKEEYFKEQIELNKKKILSTLIEISNAQKNQKIYVQKIEQMEWSLNAQDSNWDPYDISKFSSTWPDFIWPVDPLKWITAFYNDKSYEEIFWIKHNWLDIKVDQGSEVRAIANAFVLKVEQNWLDYSYVILVHKGDKQTVYGHLSQINVKQWDTILKWDTIWLSWGLPWTYWAWILTTGPHLHFEFHVKWKVIDPLEFMPKY